MNIINSHIEGLFEIEPKVFSDSRGYFFESFNSAFFLEKQLDVNFVQDNESLSQKGVLRGLHMQAPPYSQAKLVRVIKGSVLDVAVDLRIGSKTFGSYHKVILSEQNKKQLYIPKGFVHGFLTLENDTIFSYKVSEFYNRDSEVCIKWNDKSLNIDWELSRIDELTISEKDKLGIDFDDYKNIVIK